MRNILNPIAALTFMVWLGGTLQAGLQKPNTASPAKGILDVVVVDEEDNRLSGALVAVPGYRSTTGIGGSCRFGLLAGRYSVLVSKPGYRGRRVNAGVRPNETTTLQVRLQKLPTTRPPRK